MSLAIATARGWRGTRSAGHAPALGTLPRSEPFAGLVMANVNPFAASHAPSTWHSRRNKRILQLHGHDPAWNVGAFATPWRLPRRIHGNSGLSSIPNHIRYTERAVDCTTR
jgi:hypothetical protein